MSKTELIELLESILSETPLGQLACAPLKRRVMVALLEALKHESNTNR